MGFARRDAIYALLRAIAFGVGVAWALSLDPGPIRDAVTACLAIYAPYCVVLYVAGARVLRTSAKDTFYLVAAISDAVFVITLIHVSGGELRAALALWSAMYASYFGLRGGIVTGALVLLVLGAFEVASHTPLRPWLLLTEVVIAGAHGPLLGYLTDCVAREGRNLRAAREEIASAHRKLVEEQTSLIETEKHRSIAVLAAGIAHEINNPLTGIMQCARALSDDSIPESRKREYVEAILEGVGRLKNVVEGVRDYARQRPALPGDVDAAEIVDSCLRMIAPQCEEAGVRIESKLNAGEVMVRAEAAQLRKALSNVVLNAVYFSPRSDEVTIAATRRGYRWGIAVVDHGPGIAKENLSKVTHPFFTTKPPGEGTGLGLAITYGVVRASGGELEISSDEGRGTTVTMWLPASGGTRA